MSVPNPENVDNIIEVKAEKVAKDIFPKKLAIFFACFGFALTSLIGLVTGVHIFTVATRAVAAALVFAILGSISGRVIIDSIKKCSSEEPVLKDTEKLTHDEHNDANQNEENDDSQTTPEQK